MKTILLAVALFAAVVCAVPKNKRDVSQLYLPPNQQQEYRSSPKRSLKLPSTSYGVPFDVDADSVTVDSYGNPVGQAFGPMGRAQGAPPQIQDTPMLRQTYGVPTTTWAPQPMPHQTYGVPTTQAPQPMPQQTYGVPMGRQNVAYGQQQVDSNGGYVY